MCERKNVKFYKPDLILCTDNAAMIGCAAYYDYLNGKVADKNINGISFIFLISFLTLSKPINLFNFSSPDKFSDCLGFS